MSDVRHEARRVVIGLAPLPVGLWFALSRLTDLGPASLLLSVLAWALLGWLVVRYSILHRHPVFGLANLVTCTRASLVAVLAALVPFADRWRADSPDSLWWAIAAIGLTALLLDGLDGYLARARGEISDFGARFDMEIDALLSLVLSLLIWRAGIVGVWVLGLGVMRYVFVGLGSFIPALTGSLYPSRRRKVICVIQISALLLIVTPVVSGMAAVLTAAMALALLIASFMRDGLWLLTRDRSESLVAWTGWLRSMAIYRARPWRHRQLTAFHGEFIEAGDLVFDVGAHVGSRTRVFRALGARVVAVEPQPLFAQTLRRQFATDPDVVLLEVAVGRQLGTARLNISRRHPTVSTLSREWIHQVEGSDGFRRVSWDEQIDVSVLTLDELIARFGPPAFVKIDVEGLEAEILAGLSQPVNMVAFEYLPAALGVAEACVRRLDELGSYEFNISRGERQQWELSCWLGRREILSLLADRRHETQSGDVYARAIDRT